MSYIEFENVHKIYKMGDVKIKALNGASFSIDKGDFAVIAGPSGAGKSTIFVNYFLKYLSIINTRINF